MAGLGLAHEMVHMFVGCLMGDGAKHAASGPIPLKTNRCPYGRRGRPSLGGRDGQLLSMNWMRSCLRLGMCPPLSLLPGYADTELDFQLPPTIVIDDTTRRPIRLRGGSRPLQEIWGFSIDRDFGGEDLTAYFDYVNRMPVYDISASTLRDIMSNADYPSRVVAV